MADNTLGFKTEQILTALKQCPIKFDFQMVDADIIRDVHFQWSEHADTIEMAALQLDKDPEDVLAKNEIKRILHSIKGDAGVSGLTEVADVIHNLESLVEHYEAQKICPADLFLSVTDCLRDMLGVIQNSSPVDSAETVVQNHSENNATKPPVTNKESSTNNQSQITRTKKRSTKVLIAEDDLTTRTMLEGVIKKWGYQVIAAVDGEEAWAILQTPNAPNLVVLDWEMADLDGVELCRRLRNQDRKDPLYLILLTARSRSEDIVKGLEAGADDYISKPYNNAELKARIDVGYRMLILQNEMREREKLQGVLEMAGAICHELNQPLQIVSGFSEMLLEDLDTSDRNYENLETIKSGVDRIGELTRKIMKVTRYQTKPYLKRKIVDINHASE